MAKRFILELDLTFQRYEHIGWALGRIGVEFQGSDLGVPAIGDGHTLGSFAGLDGAWRVLETSESNIAGAISRRLMGCTLTQEESMQIIEVVRQATTPDSDPQRKPVEAFPAMTPEEIALCCHLYTSPVLPQPGPPREPFRKHPNDDLMRGRDD